MLDRVILHIGTHKTGTTAVQGSLGEASDALLSRGVLYPRSGRRGVGHVELARLAEHPGEMPGGREGEQELLEEIRAASPGTLVLSAERFTSPVSPRRARWAEWLCTHLDARRVQVIGYVRPQWEYIESAYAQRTKAGVTWVDFERHLHSALADSKYDYPTVFGAWRRTFGDALEIRPYAPELLVGRDVVEDFWHAVGLGSPPASLDRHRNPRTGAKATEMLRVLRSLLADYRLDGLVPVRQVMRRAQRRVEAEFPDDEPFRALTPELVARIAESFRASNATFVRDYLGGQHTSLFEPPADFPSAVATWSLERASSEELEFLGELVVEALSTLSPSSRSLRDGVIGRPPG